MVSCINGTNVVDLNKVRADKEPHIQGPAKCTLCGCEWEAVAPVGVTWIECPSCGSERGHMLGHIGFEDGQRFVCNCGNDMYTIGSNFQVMCPNCGQVHGYVDDIEC